MNTCQTCKYWILTKDAQVWLRRDDFGECSNEKLSGGLDGELLESDELCCDADFSGPYIIQFVGKDFGCIHWERK